ncbi:MAG: hypothetical protein IPM69_02385 [Ignavibacteria bacterium]|nr:hypothetical protein [Ignavibacteria bacterium]
MSVSINIPRILVKPLLYISKFLPENKFLVVCKGYGEDYDLYTGLCWCEDHHLDFVSDTQYEDFQVWMF